MVQDSHIRCAVITPEQKVLETDAAAVVIPAHDGEVGILRDRAPLLCELGMGVMRVEDAGGRSQRVLIDGGFAQVAENEVTVLTEQAALAESIDRDKARADLDAAERMPKDGGGEP